MEMKDPTHSKASGKTFKAVETGTLKREVISHSNIAKGEGKSRCSQRAEGILKLCQQDLLDIRFSHAVNNLHAADVFDQNEANVLIVCFFVPVHSLNVLLDRKFREL